MLYTPLNYDKLNWIEGEYNPSAVKYGNNKTFAFWERSLFQRAQSVLVPDIPAEWEGSVKDFLFYCLFKFGHVAIFELKERGIVFNPCNLSGYDFYYRPTKAIISNPALVDETSKSLELKIGENCQILKLTPDYRGIWDIIDYYAEKLSTLDNAVNMSLINNKFAFILGARNKVAGQALKKMLDKVNRGEPAVIYDMKLLNDPTDKEEPFQVWERRGSLKENYLTTDQLKDFQTLLNNFDTEIGIPTIPYEKKERMVQAEATSKQIDALSRATVWLDTLNGSAEQVRKLFNIPLSFELRYDPEEGGIEDAGEDNINRPVSV